MASGSWEFPLGYLIMIEPKAKVCDPKELSKTFNSILFYLFLIKLQFGLFTLKVSLFLRFVKIIGSCGDSGGAASFL